MSDFKILTTSISIDLIKYSYCHEHVFPASFLYGAFGRQLSTFLGARTKFIYFIQWFVQLRESISFFKSNSELLSKFGAISFQEYVSKGITHPVFYGDLVYKLRRVKSETNFISPALKIVKRLLRRQYDPMIIERTIGLVLGPFTALYRSFLKRCTLTSKAVGTIWRALFKPPQRRQGLDPRPLWLLVGTHSAFGPELAYRVRVA